MLSQFNVCIDDLNPARREVNRIMWYCVCSQISRNRSANGARVTALRSSRYVLTSNPTKLHGAIITRINSAGSSSDGSMRHLLAPAAVSVTGRCSCSWSWSCVAAGAIRGSSFMPHARCPRPGPTPMPRPCRMRTQITLARPMIIPYNRTCQSSANDGVKECL